MISYEDFAKLDLITAKIISTEEIEGADKLYKLTLDDGSEEKRIICAGIKEFYPPDELIGKNIVIVANLEPRTIRGIESRGMLIAAGSRESNSCVIITTEKDLPPGTKIN